MTTDRTASRVDRLLQQLTLEEQVSLLAAVDWWRTAVIERKGIFIPHIKATDGPNGARGESYVSGIKAACFPCGTSLGATFDESLLLESGRHIAQEAITKAANVLLAPTLNIIRSPLGGRNYETFSEDPVVLGRLAAAFVTGCQSQGIAATPKHFVANEAENERKTLSVDVDEQTLREIYLLPFQLVMKHSDPWCFMTSYNKVNNTYVSDDKRLVDTVLRKEWGFSGTVISDWMGVYSTTDSIIAGVDLEMPGPTKYRGSLLLKTIEDGHVSGESVQACARRVLELAEKLKRFEHPVESPETSTEDLQRDQFIAQVGAEGMVLLKNEGILPLTAGSKLALIGHHAFHASLGGGGSARVDAMHSVSPYDGLKMANFDVQIASGLPVFGALPLADPSIVLESATGMHLDRPVKVEWFNGSVMGENLALEEMRPTAEYMIKEKWPTYLATNFCTRMTFDVRPRTRGQHILSIISTGRAVCYVDGRMVYVREQETDLNPESFYFFKSKLERRFVVAMEKDTTYRLVMESWATPDDILFSPPLNGRMFQGSSLRFHEEINVPQCIADAAAVAATCDVAIVCVGTTNEIESEGFDRDDMELNCEQYELVTAVLAANPKTCVVNFSGGPVNLMPFIEKVPAMLQAWFPGQECGHALAKVISGQVDAAGRLPFSWPKRVEDSSSAGNFPSVNNLLKYEERLDVGYRWHDRPEAPDPLFPFGYGWSYTSFEIDNLACTEYMVDNQVTVSFTVCNTGARPGKATIFLFTQKSDAAPGWKRPVKELQDFVKVDLAAGASVQVSRTIDRYSASVFNVAKCCWQAVHGCYPVLVGFSATDIRGVAEFRVANDFEWTGV